MCAGLILAHNNTKCIQQILFIFIYIYTTTYQVSTKMYLFVIRVRKIRVVFCV